MDEQIRAASRSGGVFTAISDVVLSRGGAVYGCRLLKNRRAVHERATSAAQRDQFRGSKYIQSDCSGVYAQVRTDLLADRWVLFSGTPCQVNAVKDYCAEISCGKLILVDIVCHGVPAQRVWNDYCSYVEQINKKTISSVDFRDKCHFGWADHRETFYFEDRTFYSNAIFRKLFYAHYILRKDCFQCPYKNENRVGDITLADCWGIAEHYPAFNDDHGVSLVLVNTPKGEDLFQSAENLTVMAVEMEKLMQPPLKENWQMPVDYEEFWKYYQTHSFESVVRKYVEKRESYCAAAKRRLRKFVSRIYHGLR